MKIIFILLLWTITLICQTVYEIPFASRNNVIELEILNDSKTDLSNIAVTAIEKPSWISFSSDVELIDEIKPMSAVNSSFSFDIDNSAKINEESNIRFQISGNNQSWHKDIIISILPPNKFELNQNYPNPFNPTTTISYTVPGNTERGKIASIQLTIFDILGREVEILVNENQKPGFYEYDWNAANHASGIYITQLILNDNGPETKMLRKKMMLVK